MKSPKKLVMADDSMSDDVFETESDGGLKAADPRSGRPTPSPTGYKDYTPDPQLFTPIKYQDTEIAHKTILLGDSGVGKTSLLVQFDTGKFQSGTFSATVGIGFTFEEEIDEMEERAERPSRVLPQWSQYSHPYHQHHQHNYQNGISYARTAQPRHSITENCDLVCKVMLLGDSGVGKTCILVRFRDNLFLSGSFISTVGIDFRNKVVLVDDAKVKLQIWDTAGQERFRSVTHAYYRDAHALLLLYDVTNKTSYDNIRAWLGEIREYAQDNVVIMLLGNKSDCQSSERMVRREDGERLAREYSVAFMETSAKTGQNVDLAFMAIARELKARKNGVHNKSSFNVQDYVREHTQKASCPPCNT